MSSKFIALLLTTLGVASAAFAGTITYINPSNPEVKQTDQNPCVIGDPSCKNGPLAITLVPSGAFDVYSPYYTVQQIIDVVGGTSFKMGLDLNGTGSSPQTITEVGLYTNASNAGPHSGDTLVNNWTGTLTTLPLGNNGSGWSDITFLTFSLAGLDPAAYVSFRFSMSVENAGGDTLFLIKNDSSINSNDVPEPSSALLIGGGLAVLVAWRRRRAA